MIAKKIIKKIYNLLPHKIKKIIHDKYFLLKMKPLINKSKFLKKISKYDVISFDIFDTLITRKIYNPDDIFILMGEKLNIVDFINKRKNAEKLAIEKYKHDVNIDEIYDCYKEEYNLTEIEVKKIESLEKNLEIELTYPRLEMLDVFNKIKNKKTVILTSDMYLDKDTIEKMLAKNGYNGYKSFFLSNDVRARKDTGEIWTIIKEKYNKKILHIGDNQYSDYELPKKYGINSFKIYSPKEIFSKTPIYHFISDKLKKLDVNSSIFYGLMINKNIFNSPFSFLQLDSIDKVGYSLYAPLINSFMEYIENETNKDNILLFLSREGYYLQKLYQDFCMINNIEPKDNKYFLVSRKATKGALLSDYNELNSSLDDYFKGNISSFFRQILLIEYKEEDFEIELPNDKNKVIEILKKYKNEIISNGKREKNNYLNYIRKVIDEKKLKDAYLIDLGYSGSIQLNLSKMLKIDLKGLYLLSSEKIKKYKNTSTLKFEISSLNNNIFLSLYHYSLLLEFFLAAPYGQLLSFDDNANPIYNDEILDSHKQRILEQIYSKCIDYMNDVNLIKKYYDYNPNKWDIAFIFTSVIENNMINRKVKDEFDYYDDHSFSEKYNIFKRISRY